MSALAEFVAYLKSKAPEGLDSQTAGSVDNPKRLNLEGAAYFRFFTFLMLAAAILFIPFAKFYRGKTYIGGAEPVAE